MLSPKVRGLRSTGVGRLSKPMPDLRKQDGRPRCRFSRGKGDAWTRRRCRWLPKRQGARAKCSVKQFSRHGRSSRAEVSIKITKVESERKAGLAEWPEWPEFTCDAPRSVQHLRQISTGLVGYSRSAVREPAPRGRHPGNALKGGRDSPHFHGRSPVRRDLFSLPRRSLCL
jgi:hypothetical protein